MAAPWASCSRCMSRCRVRRISDALGRSSGSAERHLQGGGVVGWQVGGMVGRWEGRERLGLAA